MREVGPALHTVTSLTLELTDTGGSTVTAAVLDEALTMLADFCPALESLTISGDCPLASISCIGERCHLLSSLTIKYSSEGFAQRQLMVAMLPTILPHVTKLYLKENDTASYSSVVNLIDMSQCSSIRSLDIGWSSMLSEQEWDRLPPRLQYLTCAEIVAQPSAATAKDKALRSLVSVHTISTSIELDILAQLLRAAPFLTNIQLGESFLTGNIQCIISHTTGASFRVLQQRADVQLTRGAAYALVSGGWHDKCEWARLLAALPCMPGVVSCDLHYFASSDLCQLLRVFPNAQQLTLSWWGWDCGEGVLDDEDLHGLTQGSKLVKLCLVGCPSISPMGLMALCLQQPRIRCVLCFDCDLLKKVPAEKCMQLLKIYGLNTRITGVKGGFMF